MATQITEQDFLELRRDVAALKEQMARLESMIDVEELRAAARIEASGLNNDLLRKWAEKAKSPPGIAEVREERPW